MEKPVSAWHRQAYVISLANLVYLLCSVHCSADSRNRDFAGEGVGVGIRGSQLVLFKRPSPFGISEKYWESPVISIPTWICVHIVGVLCPA